MQRLLGIKMEVRCDVKALSITIRGNRKRHEQIVAEAREGFIEKARVVLNEKLQLLSQGKLQTLYVDLASPQSYVSEYDTILRMLDLHTEDHIVLNADEVRMFVEDKWDWTEKFLSVNSSYSSTARAFTGG